MILVDYRKTHLAGKEALCTWYMWITGKPHLAGKELLCTWYLWITGKPHLVGKELLCTLYMWITGNPIFLGKKLCAHDTCGLQENPSCWERSFVHTILVDCRETHLARKGGFTTKCCWRMTKVPQQVSQNGEIFVHRSFWQTNFNLNVQLVSIVDRLGFVMQHHRQFRYVLYRFVII